MRAWLKFASLCRKSNHTSLAQRVLHTLFGFDPKRLPANQMIPTNRPPLFYEYMKYMWQMEDKTEAFRQLQQFVHGAGNMQGNVLDPRVMEFNELLARFVSS